MKKVQTNKAKRLTLGKMTVAKLQMSQQQMRAIYGGDDTKTCPKTLTNGNPLTIIQTSLVDQNTCSDPVTANSPTGG